MIHNKIGTIRWKLADMLKEKNIHVYAGDLQRNRCSKYEIQIRWEALGEYFLKDEKVSCRVFSWDTMTELVKKDFNITIEAKYGCHEIELSVKE